MDFFYSYEISPGKFSLKVVDAAGKIIWQSIHPAFITDSLTGQLMPDETPMELGIMKNIDDIHGLEKHLKNSILLGQDDTLSIKKFEDGGGIGDSPKRKGNSYMDRVLENMQYMKSNLSDWAAVPIKGKEKTTNDKGEEMEMPVFDFPKGYTSAVSLFPMSNTGTHNCELCGKTPIKTVYWIQNDKEKKTLRVGSECVRYVGEGLSGKENLRKAKVEMAKILDNDLGRLASLLYKKYTRVEDRGYGRKERVWRTSFVGDGGTSDFWVNLKNRMAALNPTELFDSKKLNRSNKDTLYWSYVYKKIPYFGWESELRHMSQSGASEVSIESKLLSWFTKNEKLGVSMIKQVIETLEIIGSYERGEYNSDYLDAYDTNLVDKPEFEEGGELSKKKFEDQLNLDDDINSNEYKIKYISEKTGVLLQKSLNTNSWYGSTKNGVAIRISDHPSKFVEKTENRGIPAIDLNLEYFHPDAIVHLINGTNPFAGYKEGYVITHSYDKIGDVAYVNSDYKKRYVEAKTKDGRIVKYDMDKFLAASYVDKSNKLAKGGKLNEENMISKIPLKKNCRVDYTNRYSLLIDYTDGNDSIIYYEAGVKQLNQLYSDFKFAVKNELPIDNFILSFFPYPFKKVKGAVYQYAKGGKITPAKKEKLIKAVAEQYQGKKVKPKYRDKFGKRYSKKEAKTVAYAIANTVEKMKEETKAPPKKNKYSNLLPGF